MTNDRFSALQLTEPFANLILTTKIHEEENNGITMKDMKNMKGSAFGRGEHRKREAEWSVLKAGLIVR